MVLGQEKVSLLNLPTPLEFLKNISEELGIQMYIKRDDMTGLGMGGNKLRKLEYILKEAQNKGATMLITEGGVQTNHGRLTAAVAAKHNMRCAIVAIGDYPGELSANLLLDRLMGAEVIIKKDDGRPSLDQYKELVGDTIKKNMKLRERLFITYPLVALMMSVSWGTMNVQLNLQSRRLPWESEMHGLFLQ